MKKRLLIIPAIFALLLFTVSANGANIKIGYANLQKALNECAAGDEAKEELKAAAEKLEEALNTKQLELKKLKEEIDKKGSVWNKDTLNAKEQKLLDKSQDFQQQFVDSNEQLNKLKMEKEGAIIKELTDLVQELAQKKGYSYVFERSIGGLIYAPEKNDLTGEVIKLHNSRYKKKGR